MIDVFHPTGGTPPSHLSIFHSVYRESRPEDRAVTDKIPCIAPNAPAAWQSGGGNYADFYTFNPFELRGAARLIADGWEIPEIANHLIEHGGEEPFCEYTPEEETESEALLWLFQNKKKDFGDLGLSDPSPQEHGMEMG